MHLNFKKSKVFKQIWIQSLIVVIVFPVSSWWQESMLEPSPWVSQTPALMSYLWNLGLRKKVGNLTPSRNFDSLALPAETRHKSRHFQWALIALLFFLKHYSRMMVIVMTQSLTKAFLTLNYTCPQWVWLSKVMCLELPVPTSVLFVSKLILWLTVYTQQVRVYFSLTHSTFH